MSSPSQVNGNFILTAQAKNLESSLIFVFLPCHILTSSKSCQLYIQCISRIRLHPMTSTATHMNQMAINFCLDMVIDSYVGSRACSCIPITYSQHSSQSNMEEIRYLITSGTLHLLFFLPRMPAYICTWVNLSATSDSAQMSPSKQELPWLFRIYVPCFTFLLNTYHCLKYCIFYLVNPIYCLSSPLKEKFSKGQNLSLLLSLLYLQC